MPPDLAHEAPLASAREAIHHRAVAGPSPLKHKALASLRGLALETRAPTETRAPKPPLGPPSVSPLGRVVVREEMDPVEGRLVARVIGVPPARARALGVMLKEELGSAVLVEGRDLLVIGSPSERVLELLRGAGAAQVVSVPCDVPVHQDDTDAGGTDRSRIRRGLRVAVVLKADQESGTLTEGVVRDVLTRSATHPRGIKVRLESGAVGRVKRILGG